MRGNDVILWMVFVAAVLASIVLDRVVPSVMAAWGWVLILVALLAGLAALAWPIVSERARLTTDGEGWTAVSGQPSVVSEEAAVNKEAAAATSESYPAQAETLPEMSAAGPDPDPVHQDPL